MDVCGIPRLTHLEGLSIKPLLADPAAVWATPALTTHGFNSHGVRNGGWSYIRYANGE